MLSSEMLDNIKKRIAPIIEENGLCLFDASLCLQGSRLLLRLFVDKINGGVTIDECVSLNEKIGDFIEKEAVLEQGYILEISSPGTDRSLRTRGDFSRCLNHKIKIFFHQCRDGKNEIQGVVTAVDEAGLDLKSGGQVLKIPFEKIKKAKQVIEVS